MGGSKVVIAGGSGFLGQFLKARLEEDGREVVVLSRKAGPNTLAWDGRTVGDWWQALNGAEAVVNLTGKSIDCRFTPENRRQILDSRVDSVNAIGVATSQCADPPGTWLQAGAMAIYGDTGDEPCKESDAPSPGLPGSPTFQARGEVGKFMQNVCFDWEQALNDADTPRTRKVALRSAVVLDAKRGAFSKIWKLAKWGLGGQAGNGYQYFSWIHIQDWVDAVLFLLERPGLDGAFNLAAPGPVPNREFMAAVRRAAKRPWSPPVPAPMLRLGSRLIGTEGDLVLGSQRVVPARLLDAGFRFSFPDIGSALTDLSRTA